MTLALILTACIIAWLSFRNYVLRLRLMDHMIAEGKLRHEVRSIKSELSKYETSGGPFRKVAATEVEVVEVDAGLPSHLPIIQKLNDTHILSALALGAMMSIGVSFAQSMAEKSRERGMTSAELKKKLAAIKARKVLK